MGLACPAPNTVFINRERRPPRFLARPVKLLHEYTGREPTKASHLHMDGDLIHRVLKDTFDMGAQSVRDWQVAL